LGADHPNAWRWMFGVMMLPAVAFLLTALLIPERPRWLAKQGRRQEAEPLLLACMIAAFNQLDGINAVLYYASDIFRMAGADKAGALMQSVIIGVANLVMTVLAMSLIDRVGRKALLLVGSVTFVMSHV